MTNMELFATIVNVFQSLTILTKSSILDVLGVLHSPVPDKCATFWSTQWVIFGREKMENLAY